MRARDLFESMTERPNEVDDDWLPPPVMLGPSVLPLHDLGDRRFERLAHWWAEIVDGNVVARIHGPSGRPDFGIDVLARQANGRYWAYQCKCVKEFRPSQLAAAVAEFVKHDTTGIERFTVFVACEGDDTALEPELSRLNAAHADIEIEALYQGNLSNKLYGHPSKVAAMFGAEWARAFCGGLPGAGITTKQGLGDCLPRESAHFVGRKALLDDTLANLAGRSNDAPACVVTVTGSPGVGKTALAIRLARAANEMFPDGQLFITDDGEDDLVATLLSLVTGGPRDPRENHAQRLARVRSALVRQKLVVLVDDVRGEEAIRELASVAGDSVMIVATSRRKLTGLADLDSILIDLEVLSTRESIQLVRAVAGTDRLTSDQCNRLVVACGGLPLAIRVAASRIARRPQLDVDRYLSQVEHPDLGIEALAAGDRSVAAIVDDSYNALPETRRIVLHALGICRTALSPLTR